MQGWIKNALVLLLFLALGIGGGYGFQVWREASADAATVTRIDRATPGLPGERVVLVSLSTCPACAAARNWLKEKGQPYLELAVDQSDAARALADQLNIRSVPVLIVGDQAVNGFDAGTFERLLAPPGTLL